MPARVVSILPNTDDLPATHPAAAKTMVEDKPTAYVCEGTVCSAPVTDPAALTELLSGA